jgi:hypothetical protein
MDPICQIAAGLARRETGWCWMIRNGRQGGAAACRLGRIARVEPRRTAPLFADIRRGDGR